MLLFLNEFHIVNV